ncbi:MAG: hypothetical protein HFF36_02445 [Coprobacillus sp.]|nr:hypothetical protein [Coprobacillus sp.]
MKCEKCGKEISFLNVNHFNHDGSDSYLSITFEEVPDNAVLIETNKNWTGYDLSEEEMIETIQCPLCGKFPFKNEEIQLYELVKVVMFKKGVSKDDE